LYLSSVILFEGSEYLNYSKNSTIEKKAMKRVKRKTIEEKRKKKEKLRKNLLQLEF